MRWFSLSFLLPRGGLSAALLLAGTVTFAADARPTVGPGATKEDALNAYGWPTGQSQAGTKEILTYPQGKIILENGRVERVDFSTAQPWPAPRPRPGTPPPSSARPPPEASVDFWVTSFEEAAQEAKKRRLRILALFTGSDWSPASQQFQEEVEYHQDFINTVAGRLVLLRLDFPTRTVQAPEVQRRNAELRTQYGVTTYPSLLLLEPDGRLVARVDLEKVRAGEPYRPQVIAILREMQGLLTVSPAPVAPAAPAPEKKSGMSRIEAIKDSMQSAGWVLTAGMAAGIALAALMLWWLWRARGFRSMGPLRPMSGRIGDAASGVPSPVELRDWSVEKVRALTAVLAETEGHVVTRLAGNPDFALARPGEKKPRVLVSCVSGHGGPVTPKRMRELMGAMTLESVGIGWFVSPAGFTAEARAYAAQHGIQLIESEALLTMLRDLPPLILPKVLGRIAAPPSGSPPAAS